MKHRSKSTLFLMEQLVVIAVFAVCAAACVKILTHSYLTSKEANDLSNAILAAENGAESYKAAGGDIAKAAFILGGIERDIDGKSTAIVYYNNTNGVCTEADSVYVLRLISDSPGAESSLSSALLEIEKNTGEELLTLTVTARGSK